MATLVWSDEKIVEAMIRFHKINGKWPKSRDWWFANKGRWPSFTTVCNRPLRWKGLLKAAQMTESGALKAGYPIAMTRDGKLDG